MKCLLSIILKTPEEKITETLSLIEKYRQVKIPKKNGGYRVIYIPPETLKRIQRKILKVLQKM